MRFATTRRIKTIIGLPYMTALAKRSGVMVMLLAGFVLLLHLMGIAWLRQPIDESSESNTAVPFNVEVTLLGKDSQSSKAAASSPVKPQTKPETKPKPQKAPPVQEKLPDIGEIEQMIKSRSVKEVSKSVKYQPEKQTAQAVSASMVMPPTGKASARDNFPISDMHNPSPEYPEMAIFLDYQGTAIVRIKVSAKGLSEGVQVLRSSGFDLLDKSAVNALKRWRFTPSKNGNTPVASSVVISVIYEIYRGNRQ
jgi:protein TonB